MIVFLQPLWLWGLLTIPVLLVWLLWVQRRYWLDAFHFSQVSLLQLVSAHPHAVWQQRIGPLCLLLAYSFTLLGLAQPTLQTRVASLTSALMLALDISLSMEATDMAPNRLEAEKQAAIKFIETLPAETQAGLAFFAGNTYVASPPTTDHQSLLALLESMTLKDLRSGTALGDAVVTTLDSLSHSASATAPGSGQGKAIILMTDGENNMGLGTDVARDEARRLHIPVFTVGLGDEAGTTIRKGLFTRLDETALQRLALETGGDYYRVRKFGDFRRIYAPLSKKAQIYRETQVSLVPLCLAGVLLGVLSAFGWGITQRRF